MSLRITSFRNQRVKDAVRLRDRRGRKMQQRIIIDGAREILRAMGADVDVLELFVCENHVRSDEGSRVIELAGERGIDLLPTTPEVFGKLAFGQRDEGVVAVAARPSATWPSEPFPEEAVIVVLEHVENPGNLGGVLRTADASGVHALFVADGRVDLYSPNAIRASLGTVFSMPLIAATSTDILRWLRTHRTTIYAARVDGAVGYTSVCYRGRVALVLGSESRGLSSLWSGADITSVVLPMLGQADSLNLSVTSAVLMYEALRQKSQDSKTNMEKQKQHRG